MGSIGRRFTACLLACGLAAPAVASVFAPADGADKALCAQQSTPAGGCPGGGAMLASADDMAAVGLGAQPIAGSAPAGGSVFQAVRASAGQVRISEIASLLVFGRSAATAERSAAPALFWVFGSGLLGAAFVARRRKPARAKA